MFNVRQVEPKKKAQNKIFRMRAREKNTRPANASARYKMQK